MAKIKFNGGVKKVYTCPNCHQEGPRGRMSDFRWADQCAACLAKMNDAIARYLMGQNARAFQKKSMGLGF